MAKCWICDGQCEEEELEGLNGEKIYCWKHAKEQDHPPYTDVDFGKEEAENQWAEFKASLGMAVIG